MTQSGGVMSSRELSSVGPPDDVLGGLTAIELDLIRSDDAKLSVRYAETYPTGCQLMIHVAVRRSETTGMPPQKAYLDL